MRIGRRRLLLGVAGLAGLAGFSAWRWQARALAEDRVTTNGPRLAPFARTIRAQNVDVNVVDVGEGPTVLFLHGIPDTSDLWADSIGRLQATRRCIAIDLPDFGRSRVTSGTFDWSAANRGRFVADVLDQLGIDAPIRLVAHNAGGTFGAIFTAAHAERVERALFTVTTIHPDHAWHLPARINRTPGLGELAMAAYSWERFRRTVGAFSGPGFDEARMRETFARVDGRMKRAILAFYRSTDRTLYRDWQARFESAVADIPLRVVWGELNPGANVDLARRSFPTDDVRVYSEVGHWPMLEQRERWLDDLESFV